MSSSAISSNAILEAIISHPLLLVGVTRLIQQAGQSHRLLTISHANSTRIKAVIARFKKGLGTAYAAALS